MHEAPSAAAHSAPADGEPSMPAGAGASASDGEPNTVFVKIERLRRLHSAREFVHDVSRGEDGTFGLGLSEDNEIIKFYHDTNAGRLRLGDQVRAVGDAPLVRERLSSVVQRHHGDDKTVPMLVSRAVAGDQKEAPVSSEVFGSLQLRSAMGEELDEWLSELWTLRPDTVWGTYWTLPILPGTTSVWLGIYLSKLFTEPLFGWVEIPLTSLHNGPLDTRWYSLREERAHATSRDLVGEILLSVKHFHSAHSVRARARSSGHSQAIPKPFPST